MGAILSTLLQAGIDHWCSATLVVIATLILVGVSLGDGASVYQQYPFVGQGLLKPWLNWSMADRWRLHELEPVAYGKYTKRDQPWSVTFWGLHFLVMPPKYLRDLRTQDRHALNLAKCLSDALNMEASVGDVPIANTMEIDVVSRYLNSRIDETIPLLNDEANFVFNKEIGKTEVWKKFKTMDLSSKLVHYISNRILVGPELCRRADYRATTESLNMSHVIFGALWNFIPLGVFRKPFYWAFSIPYRMQIRRAMNRYIVPIVEERMADVGKTNTKKTLDTIQLMVDMPPASPREIDSFRHAIRILHLHFASTGSSIALVHTAIWQLLQMPECMEPIRTEIKDVLRKYGSWDSKHTVNHLHLLDSFVREVLRVYVPSAQVVSLRLAQQPVTLHDGFQLKKGTRIVFPAQSIHSDPANYEDPREFLPFRFSGSSPCDCDADGTPKDAGRIKADSPDVKYLPFGYGKQSCPGRFFATRVVKLILGRLIYEYDIKPEGNLPSSPVSGSMEGFFLPTKKFYISLRSRRPASDI